MLSRIATEVDSYEVQIQGLIVVSFYVKFLRNLHLKCFKLIKEYEDRKIEEVKVANKPGDSQVAKADVKTAPYWFEDGRNCYYLETVDLITNICFRRYWIK